MWSSRSLVNLTLTFAALILCSRFYVHSAIPKIDSGEGYSNPKELIKTEEQILKDLQNLELNLDSTPAVERDDPDNGNPNQNNTPGPIRDMIPPSGNLVMYRQSNYSNSLPNGCIFSYAGCGPSAVANIVANLKNRAVTPVDVLAEYRRQGSYLGCSGSTMAGAKKVLENSYGFTTFEIIPEGSAALPIDQAVQKLLPFIAAGNWVFIGANYSGGGHYAVITDIKKTSSGYELYALDSVYGNPTVIPVNYTYMRPYPKIKKAMAVYPNK